MKRIQSTEETETGEGTDSPTVPSGSNFVTRIIIAFFTLKRIKTHNHNSTSATEVVKR